MDRTTLVALRWLACLPLVGMMGSPSPAVAPSPRLPLSADADEASGLSIMTYNVEGLPWPVRSGRDKAALRIADRLRGLRAEGRQPHVVVLQEAFGPAQRAIGAKAGYAYVVDGPGARDRNPAARDAALPADHDFLSRRYTLRGEGWGKWVGSGLVLLSDYPVLATARIVFPDYACAGFDCLANKGALVALVAVPGSPQPVAVIATHLNAKEASAVPRARFTYAFARQMDLLGAFLREHLPEGTPFVLAGDTNVGSGRVRARMFGDMLRSLPQASATDALSACLTAACTIDAPADAEAAHDKGKDLEIWADGREVALRPAAVSVPFGREPDGSMLSDHVGYTIRYALDVKARAAVASR